MTTYRTRAVFLAILMLVSPIAGVAGSAAAATTAGPDAAETQQSVETIQGSLSGDSIDLTDNVSLWERAALSLRVDRAGADGVSTSVDNLNARVSQSGLGTTGLNIPELVVYENDATLELSFKDARAGATSETSGSDLHLISVKADSTDAPDAPTSLDVQGLREFAENESDSENLFIENVSTEEIENGEANFQFDLSESNRGAGSYTFMAVRTTEGSGFTVDNGNISVDGQVEILGADAAVVHQTASDITPEKDRYEPGDTIKFDVDANLGDDADRVEHAVALWNESAVSDEELTIVVPDDFDSDTTVDEFTIEHSIADVAGEANMEDDVTAFGQTISSNDRSGVVALSDVISFLANEGEFTGPNTDQTGDEVTINASITSINSTSGDETIEVGTLDSFETGEYVAVHMAMADGDLTQTSSNRTTVSLVDERAKFQIDDVTLALGDTSLTVGDTTDATVTAAFTDASTTDVTGQAAITSNDASVATVDGTEVTAEGSGTTTIEATYTENGETKTDTVELTVDEDAPAGSPGGGGGVPAPSDPDEPVDVEPPEPPADVTVELDETVDFEFDGETGQTTATFSEQSAVDSVTFNSEVAGSVNARTLDRETDETGPAPGASAAVSQISVGDELRDQPATIGMRVSQERLAEIDADVEDLRVNRFADGEWQGLDTEIVDETDTHVRIQAETPGFSYFAASAVSEPEAAASVSPETVTTDETVELSGSESTDRYGEIVAYDWEIDGETFSGETTTLTVDEPGEYTAELTVTNDAGETDTATVDFTATAVDDGDVPDDTDEEAFGTGAIAVIVLVIIAILAAAGVAVMRRKE